MNTDRNKFAIYECEQCKSYASTGRVHDVSNAEGPNTQKWICRRCILEKKTEIRCRGCNSINGPLYEIYEKPFCAPCIHNFPTVRDAIEGPDSLEIDHARLRINPEMNVEAVWDELSGEVA